MAGKGYYESEGTKYLNEQPTVKTDSKQVYSKDEINQAKGQIEKNIYSIDDKINQVAWELEHHAHPIASDTAPGFMSPEQKKKLDGIGDTQTPEYPVVSVNGKKGDVQLSAQDVGAAPTIHTHSNASPTVPGFMSTTDKDRLNRLMVMNERICLEVNKSATQQAIPSATMTKVTWDGIVRNYNSNAPPLSNNTFIAPRDGLYHLDLQIASPRLSQYAALEVYLFKNNLQYTRLNKVVAPGVTSIAATGSFTMFLSQSDYIDIRVFTTEALQLYNLSYLVITEVS